MSDFDPAATVSVGDATKVEHWLQLLYNTLALRQIGGLDCGGQWDGRQTDASFAPIAGHVVHELDGDVLGGVELHFMGKVDGGTGQVRLYNITDAGAVGSVNVTGTSDPTTPLKITGLTLAAGVKSYRVEALKGTTWIKVWGARLIAR